MLLSLLAAAPWVLRAGLFVCFCWWSSCSQPTPEPLAPMPTPLAEVEVRCVDIRRQALPASPGTIEVFDAADRVCTPQSSSTTALATTYLLAGGTYRVQVRDTWLRIPERSFEITSGISKSVELCAEYRPAIPVLLELQGFELSAAQRVELGQHSLNWATLFTTVSDPLQPSDALEPSWVELEDASRFEPAANVELHGSALHLGRLTIHSPCEGFVVFGSRSSVLCSVPLRACESEVRLRLVPATLASNTGGLQFRAPGAPTGAWTLEAWPAREMLGARRGSLLAEQQIEHLPPGWWKLSVRGADRWVQSRFVEVVAGTTRELQPFVVTQPCVQSFIVLHEGRAIPGASVSLRPFDGPGLPPPPIDWMQQVADAQGRVVFRGLAAGDYHLRVETQGTPVLLHQRVLSIAGQASEPVRVECESTSYEPVVLQLGKAQASELWLRLVDTANPLQFLENHAAINARRGELHWQAPAGEYTLLEYRGDQVLRSRAVRVVAGQNRIELHQPQAKR